MKKIPVMMIACLLGVWQGCSDKPRDSGGFGGVFERLSRAEGLTEKRAYFTSDTVSAIDHAVSQGAVSERDKLSVLPRFDEKTKWEQVLMKVDGERGMIRIRYTDHPVENMIGLAMDFRMKKEKGTWKIDLADEIRTALQLRRNRSAAEYIQRVK